MCQVNNNYDFCLFLTQLEKRINNLNGNVFYIDNNNSSELLLYYRLYTHLSDIILLY